MNIQMKGNEQITKLLNDWYQAMLQQQVSKATKLKQEVDNKIKNVETDYNISLYHALLNFRYNVLTDWVSIKDDSFDQVESFERPTEGFLSYYYHFFKALHLRLITNYTGAKEQFDKAETLLQHIVNPFEKAEFHYRLGEFYYHSYQHLKSIDCIRKAKEDFSKQGGYEINLALCENIYGLCCIDLKQFELAEEALNTALDLFQKINHEKYMLMVRHNLAWLYTSQNLSKLAIRHISEVTKNNPKHFKALFVEAREYYKLGEYQIADEIIKRGLNICLELHNKELQHHFMILKELNNQVSASTLENTILEGISYFEKENLWKCVQEYTKTLAIKFYEEDNHSKASYYFFMSDKAQENELQKGALK
ncbi:Rap family tetratricopeptide repeat protein [Bacillus cereus group sp. BfR-BA-01380]|uniref:Rap family tetratricopeptide repeat protein n=1 Tax=Bacillus cereus group sp. BfR-BA-01380 TaxID=2920324 RepID=UPI001F55ED62|nr:Rap family tetratricopeptide repeat protein [Bacillus cereus group sp. BfR-BA-01380]